MIPADFRALIPFLEDIKPSTLAIVNALKKINELFPASDTRNNTDDAFKVDAIIALQYIYKATSNPLLIDDQSNKYLMSKRNELEFALLKSFDPTGHENHKKYASFIFLNCDQVVERGGGVLQDIAFRLVSDAIHGIDALRVFLVNVPNPITQSFTAAQLMELRVKYRDDPKISPSLEQQIEDSYRASDKYQPLVNMACSDIRAALALFKKENRITQNLKLFEIAHIHSSVIEMAKKDLWKALILFKNDKNMLFQGLTAKDIAEIIVANLPKIKELKLELHVGPSMVNRVGDLREDLKGLQDEVIYQFIIQNFLKQTNFKSLAALLTDQDPEISEQLQPYLDWEKNKVDQKPSAKHQQAVDGIVAKMTYEAEVSEEFPAPAMSVSPKRKHSAEPARARTPSPERKREEPSATPAWKEAVDKLKAADPHQDAPVVPREEPLWKKAAAGFDKHKLLADLVPIKNEDINQACENLTYAMKMFDAKHLATQLSALQIAKIIIANVSLHLGQIKEMILNEQKISPAVFEKKKDQLMYEFIRKNFLEKTEKFKTIELLLQDSDVKKLMKGKTPVNVLAQGLFKGFQAVEGALKDKHFVAAAANPTPSPPKFR